MSWPQTEYLFWCVALAFYLFDAIKLVPKLAVPICPTSNGKWAPLINLSGYELKGMDVVIAPLLMPFVPVFRLRCDPALRSDSADLEAADKRLAELRQLLRPFAWLSTASLAVLLCGVLLTYTRGFSYALLAVAPVHALILLAMGLLMVLRRERLGLSRISCVQLIFEAMVVPAYLACTLRRLAWRQVLDVDGYAYCLRSEPDLQGSQLAYRIAAKLDLTMLAFEPGRSSHERFRTYKEWLGV